MLINLLSIDEVKESKMADRMTGKIKLFDPNKGYGFIERQGGKDVFFHVSSIEAPVPESIRAGQAVEFSVEKGPKGPQAANVKVIR